MPRRMLLREHTISYSRIPNLNVNSSMFFPLKMSACTVLFSFYLGIGSTCPICIRQVGRTTLKLYKVALFIDRKIKLGRSTCRKL